jgi:hypothetical protein
VFAVATPFETTTLFKRGELPEVANFTDGRAVMEYVPFGTPTELNPVTETLSPVDKS